MALRVADLPPAKRCAIYTRKSSEQPVDHQFSSLEAQRAICSAYIASQKPKGWIKIAKHYDDDARSGGNLLRPALQELLSDLENGLVDVVVIYKLDRMSRSLIDFVRLMDLFESYGVGFVAVTQNFDTGDSTGRLILNVLLTFAQFEREIASDRLRDKFSAMRQRGMFVGGNQPFGYDLKNKKLEINPSEADAVRWMFKRYLECQRPAIVCREAKERGITLRARVSKRGIPYEPRAFSHGGISNILGNPLYVGQVRSKGNCYPGAHEAIIDQELWAQVQALRAKRTRAKIVEIYKTDLLRGLMYDSYGRTMGVLRDHRYATVRRYYISNQSEWGRRHGVRRYRTRADALESLIMAWLTSWLSDREHMRGLLLKAGTHGASLKRLSESGARIAKALSAGYNRQAQSVLKGLVERIELSSLSIRIVVRTSEVPRVLGWDGVGLFRGDDKTWSQTDRVEVVEIPASTLSMKRELTLLLKRTSAEPGAVPNRHLVSLLKKARTAQAALDDRSVFHVNGLAAKVGCHPKRFTRLVRLNYLAPDIIAAILDGTQPGRLTCRSLTDCDLPMDWSLQRRLLGFPDQPDFLRAAPGW